MTYDELLAQPEKDFKLYSSNQKYGAAVRAVVELHKPRPSQFDDLECSQCTGDEEITLSIAYPCPTIQAIEKEFNG